jgi:lipoprotein-anchoring transpeptidase ErfK/SrfK
MVLKVGEIVKQNDEVWYKIIFDEWLRYPERVTSDWYVNGAYVRLIQDVGDETIRASSSTNGATPSSKKIIVDRTEQKLYAYDGDTLFMEIPISTGLELTPTPRGVFTIFKKTPSRYMQGPLPNLADQQSYDLPGVPWNLYFTEGGAVIHGAYWHDSFGNKYSHGCVNLSPENAHSLYSWAELGTTVTVRD